MSEPKFVDLSKYPGLDVRTIRVRALTGDDTVVAAARCAPAEGASLDATLFSIMLRQQQIAQSIVEVDGEPVRGPCLSSIHWNARTRDFVGMIYDSINGVTTAEREGFLATLNGASGESTQVAESDNG